MQAFIKWLRGFGTIGEWTATAVTFATTNWGLVMSALIAAWASLSETVSIWLQKPSVYIFGGVFLFCLWTYLGLSAIKTRKKPQYVKILHDYTHALIVEGWLPSFGKFAADHPTSANKDAITLTCNFRNVSHGPVRVKIEDVRVILNGRTCDDTTPFELIFANFAIKGVRCGAIERDINQTHLHGTAYFKFLYGHPDGDFLRKYTLKLKIQIAINNAKNEASINDSILEETDEPIR